MSCGKRWHKYDSRSASVALWFGNCLWHSADLLGQFSCDGSTKSVVWCHTSVVILDVCRWRNIAPSFVLVKSPAVVDDIVATMHRWHISNLIRGTMIRTTDIFSLRTACKKKLLTCSCCHLPSTLTNPLRYHLLVHATEWHCPFKIPHFGPLTSSYRTTSPELHIIRTYLIIL